ncbi:patatin-like phospholipase family protein [Rhizobium sp. ICMP 5592]|uniref:patatin-like phospholipase family protein n=1 Tax=Rhizobium sp. ICMP 5592 TaxID=2292445 RepID=UPI0012980EA7|nr:patatin-like phospholipase family protein [Rhizobium sp. ICMP 5592]MQB44977.1 alpha/beta hydrolase [Rhizobium sp. ICMP 5592]
MSGLRSIWLFKRSWTRALVVLLPFLLILSGCMQTLDRALDASEADKASIAGYGEIRTYLDARLDEAPRDASNWAPATRRGRLDALMISGGGAGGAFSVGVLSAWSTAKTRPQFDVVTGVSTGALIAPYAFLGSAYDDTLVRLYTSGVAQELVRTKGFVGLFGSSLLRAGPLRQMIERFITPAILQQVAAEHRKGRRLFILTTNLDTQRAVVWNMGAIANSGRPDALKLFQDVLTASASIPGVYPAVMIKAESGGRQFEEMHSDGGSSSQVLMIPQALLTSSQGLLPTKGQAVNFYVIVNNALMPEFATTPDKTLPVIVRAYSIFVKSQTQSALTALYTYSKLTRARFHLASIDAQVPYSMFDPFNTNYMRAVYNLGYAEFVAGTLWKDKPVFR